MIQFILNNKIIKTSENIGTTLLDFIRYEQRLTGTKIGCREGDCGACTVLMGKLDKNGSILYESITSCISPLGNAHGKHILTIEGVNLNNRLNVAQQEMKDNYATQCGFCTPGFVVSLTGFALSSCKKNTENALDAVSGNICRCTGYKSIERATSAISDKLNSDTANISLKWLIDNDFVPEYLNGIPEKLQKLKLASTPNLEVVNVSGGTDLYVQKADELAEEVIGLIADDDQLKDITIKNGACTIGAGTTVTEFWKNKELVDYFPQMGKHLKLVSSEQIRNMASFGGNLVNASPIGDMTIFFLALNSRITIVDAEQGERSIPLNTFFKGYKTLDLIKGELVKSIEFVLPTSKGKFNFEKVCKRTHLDIASVNSAIYIRVEEETIKEAHVSIGGVAPIPKYLHRTSDFLTGNTLNPEVILEADKVLQEEISPISDVRGSSEYKRLLARQLFFAHFMELFPEQFKLNKLVRYA